MTSTFKTILAAAAFIAASAAHAEWQFVSGTGTLTFAQDGLDAFNVADTYLNPGCCGPDNKTIVSDQGDSVTLALTSGTTAGNNVQTLTSTGSTLDVERTRIAQGHVFLDKVINLSNFAFDFNTRTLSAQMMGTNLLTGATTQYGLQPIFSAPALIGSTAISGGKMAFSTVGPLSFNSATADTVLDFLDISTGWYLPSFPPATVKSMWKNADWGTFSGQATLSAVPEPSVYLSVLAGLAVLGAARARRRSHL